MIVVAAASVCKDRNKGHRSTESSVMWASVVCVRWGGGTPSVLTVV